MHDFYSDTQTRPTPAMLDAIQGWTFGDERHHADPATNALNARVAEMLGMEAAVFLPSGTMCNEIAIAVHCRPGDEVICTRQSHVIFAESGGPAALSGVMLYPIDSENGLISPDAVQAAIRPPAAHSPRSRLLITEQTSNLGGGTVWPADQLGAVAETAKAAGLAAHLDGARLMNACVASGLSPADYAKAYDSAWIGFTKGLGAPVGAVLAGRRDFIEAAWLHKRRWGGAMRQTGVIAAMCLYALDHHVARLAEDHARAARIGAALAEMDVIARVLPVETNIVIADLAEAGPDARSAAHQLFEAGVKVTVVGRRRLRIVTHMDVGDAAADALISAVAGLN